jgi:hypothetical protein
MQLSERAVINDSPYETQTYETQNSPLLMCFKTLTFDRNNITLSYLSNHLKFCNDCNKLNKLY